MRYNKLDVHLYLYSGKEIIILGIMVILIIQIYG